MLPSTHHLLFSFCLVSVYSCSSLLTHLTASRSTSSKFHHSPLLLNIFLQFTCSYVFPKCWYTGESIQVGLHPCMPAMYGATSGKQMPPVSHVTRKDDDRLPNIILFSQVEHGHRNVRTYTRRNTGLPRLRFRDTLKMDKTLCNMWYKGVQLDSERQDNIWRDAASLHRKVIVELTDS